MNAELAPMPGADHPQALPRPHHRLRRRAIRWLAAAAEVLAAAALVVLAVLAWRHTFIPVELPPSDNPAIPRSTTRMSGPWTAAAVGAATAAGLFLLDALREAVLAVRAGHDRVHNQ